MSEAAEAPFGVVVITSWTSRMLIGGFFGQQANFVVEEI
jgi:hypothetical protein